MAVTKVGYHAVFLMVVLNRAVLGYTVVLEAESGTTNGVRMTRSAASNQLTVWLHQGDHLQTSFIAPTLCDVVVTTVVYTNDGGADTVTVLLDSQLVIGTFNSSAVSNYGAGWNVPRHSGVLWDPVELGPGLHYIRIEATNTDQYGIEIDQATLSLLCVCFNDPVPADDICQNSSNGMAIQRSVETLCAEEDNINVPIYYDDIQEYSIVATLPVYSSYTDLNNRSPNFTNCSLTSRLIWQIGTDDGSSEEFTSCTSGERNYSVGQPFSDLCKDISRNVQEQTITFTAKGTSSGLVEASIGSVLTITFSEVSGILMIEASCFGREEEWIHLGAVRFDSDQKTQSWEVPDLTWSEEPALNHIRLSVVNGTAEDAYGLYDYIKLEMRQERGEYEVVKIYDQNGIVIEIVRTDYWWLYPQAMVIKTLNNEQEWYNVTYFRVALRVPQTTGYAQLFVLYQDGNCRILTFPPGGYDWIPFGSSVILGQSDPSAARPYAAISKVDIDPASLRMTIYYSDGGYAVVILQANAEYTMVKVGDISFAHAANLTLPFATFRSMWVEDGNADVDHVAVSTEKRHILSGWEQLNGTVFSFFRSCISQHNTLAPDIRIEINCSSTAELAVTMTTAEYTETPAVTMTTAEYTETPTQVLPTSVSTTFSSPSVMQTLTPKSSRACTERLPLVAACVVALLAHVLQVDI